MCMADWICLLYFEVVSDSSTSEFLLWKFNHIFVLCARSYSKAKASCIYVLIEAVVAAVSFDIFA